MMEVYKDGVLHYAWYNIVYWAQDGVEANAGFDRGYLFGYLNSDPPNPRQDWYLANFKIGTTQASVFNPTSIRPAAARARPVNGPGMELIAASFLNSVLYRVPAASSVSLKIYNSGGQLVRTLVSAQQDAGQYAAQWDGRNEQGIKASAGAYWCRLQTEKRDLASKMVVMR
jgi:hypothetical protein